MWLQSPINNSYFYATMKNEAKKLFRFLRTKPVPVNTNEILALERTKLANERTLLSYIRSSLYLLLGGIGILQLKDFESIKWLDDMDIVVIVLDATENPYNQVNITILGNLMARKIPVLIVANKIDLKKASIKKIEAAFPEYDVVGLSAKYGKNLEEFYESLLKLSKKV